MKLANELFEFINKSPSPYHTVSSAKSELLASGYTELFENEAWSLSDGGKYFVVRGGTSVIAFKYNYINKSLQLLFFIIFYYFILIFIPNLTK